ncbi:MAG: hypothetical protein DI536_36880, partial [Archangium gephyra]
IDEVFDLSVDHPLHTYVVDGVIVHNKPPFRGPPGSFCFTEDGSERFSQQVCDCPLGQGSVVCTGTAASCDCGRAPAPQVSTFYRSRWFAFGDGERALLNADGGSRLRCGPSPRALNVISADSVGWFRDESVVELRGIEPCFIDVDVDVRDAGSTWGHLWIAARGYDVFAPGVLRIDDTVLLEVANGQLWFKPALDANGQPASPWYANELTSSWQRFEWRLELLSPTTYRFWPRLGPGTEPHNAPRFRTNLPDGGFIMLSEWYAQGNAFAFVNEADGGVRVVSFGQDARSHAGTRLHAASFSLSNDGWIGE